MKLNIELIEQALNIFKLVEGGFIDNEEDLEKIISNLSQQSELEDDGTQAIIDSILIQIPFLG